MRNKKRRKIVCLTIAAAFAVFSAGCSNERLENELANRKLGISYMESGEYEAAVTAFEKALEEHIGGVGKIERDIAHYKAAAQYAKGDMEAAMAAYQALIEYDSEDADAYYLRGCLYLTMGESQKALADYESALRYRQEDYELYVQIYEKLAGYNLEEEGKEYLGRALDIKGNGAKNLAWRGKIYYLLEEYEKAQKELKIAIGKKSMEANLYLAQVYDALGNPEEASNYYEAYISSGMADADAMNAIGRIEMDKGNYTGALEYFEQGLAMEEVTNRRELMQNQVIAYEYTGDFARAWQVISEYITLYPEDEKAQREYVFLENRNRNMAGENQIQEDTDGTPETGEQQESTETERAE